MHHQQEQVKHSVGWSRACWAGDNRDLNVAYGVHQHEMRTINQTSHQRHHLPALSTDAAFGALYSTVSRVGPSYIDVHERQTSFEPAMVQPHRLTKATMGMQIRELEVAA
jgi:hypothetical protein